MERLDIVDEYGNPTGETVERTHAHANGVRHRTAHIWIARKVRDKCLVDNPKYCVPVKGLVLLYIYRHFYILKFSLRNRMKRKNIKKLYKAFTAMISSLVIAFCAFSEGNVVSLAGENGGESKAPVYTLVQDINYNESPLEVNNPERGWYHVQHVNLYLENNSVVKLHSPGSSFAPIAKEYSLVHLLVDLSEFSKGYNQTADIELTQNALDTLDGYLTAIKAAGKTAIVRFAYDKNYEGKAENYNKEPAMDMILRHIEQVGGVLSAHAETVSCVECGMFGPWGEMHTSNMLSKENRKQSLTLVMNKWLEVLPTEITVNVRQPEFYTIWSDQSIGEIDQNITEKGQQEYRVGVYNDGYLGSKSDLGTFRNREKEVAWLSNQAKHTLYGGEVCAWQGSEDPGNTVMDIAGEGFLTHTAYLNWAWNLDVIKGWGNQTYTGSDPVYNGKSGLIYVSNHLGYRFVLREAQITDSVFQGDNLELKLKVSNVGFGNMVKPKKVTILTENAEGEIEEYPVDVDITTWDSGEDTLAEVSVPIAEECAPGEYKVYLRMSQDGNLAENNNYLCVKFANEDYEDQPIYNMVYGANYVGVFTVAESVVLPSNEPSEEPSNEPSETPSNVPSADPSNVPSETPSESPSTKPSTEPSTESSTKPCISASIAPSIVPSNAPSEMPSITPSETISIAPTTAPTAAPAVKAYRLKSVKVKDGRLIIKTRALGKKADGYQIQYSYTKKFKKVKTKNLKASQAKTLRLKINKKKNTCYVRVRTYRKIIENGKLTKKYSKWISYKRKIL